MFVQNCWDYESFYFSEYKDRPWDYCAAEVKRYNIAKEEGFEKYFAKTEFLGFVNDYPVYIQERGIVFSETGCSYTKEVREETSEICSGIWCGINTGWLTDFRFCYGKNELIDFLTFLQCNGWDDDLRNDNCKELLNILEGTDEKD